MVDYDEAREVPSEWTDELCGELYRHAQELGHYGNPAGYFLTIALFPFVGIKGHNGSRYLRAQSKWDYDGMRAWIAENKDRVERVWRFQVKTVY